LKSVGLRSKIARNTKKVTGRGGKNRSAGRLKMGIKKGIAGKGLR